MEHNLNTTVALLERTPGALSALLRGLPEEWTHRSEGEGTFTAVDVVGHLIYADKLDWIPRARMILEYGETRPFEPFDRWGHVEECRDKSLPQILDEFARVRAKSLDELRLLDVKPEQLHRKGLHPALGPVMLSQLLATWAAHDLTHLHQVSRILAHQYREAVGPWSAFLGVMKCDGHSA